MTDIVLVLCKAMGATDDQEELLRPLVQATQEELEKRLKPGVEAVECETAFSLATAMMVMERLESISAVQGVTSFTAGDVTIHRDSKSGSAGSLTAQAERLLAPWLGDTGFLFRGVRG